MLKFHKQLLIFSFIIFMRIFELGGMNLFELGIRLTQLPQCQFDLEHNDKLFRRILWALSHLNSPADRKTDIIGISERFGVSRICELPTFSTANIIKFVTVREYIATFKVDGQLKDADMIVCAFNNLDGELCKMPSAVSVIDPELQLQACALYDNKLLAYNKETGIAVGWFMCGTGANVRKLCIYFGFTIDIGVKVLNVIRNESTCTFASKL